MTLEQRFWDKVDKGDADECWGWQAVTNEDGYGQFFYDGQMTVAHRIAYLLSESEPGDDYVLHTCHNPPCVNPNHLYAGTQKQNVQDSVELGTHFVPEPRRGEENDHSKLTESQVKDILRMDRQGKLHSEIAEKFPVCRSQISMIARGERWPQVSVPEREGNDG